MSQMSGPTPPLPAAMAAGAGPGPDAAEADKLFKESQKLKKVVNFDEAPPHNVKRRGSKGHHHHHHNHSHGHHHHHHSSSQPESPSIDLDSPLPLLKPLNNRPVVAPIPAEKRPPTPPPIAGSMQILHRPRGVPVLPSTPGLEQAANAPLTASGQQIQSSMSSHQQGIQKAPPLKDTLLPLRNPSGKKKPSVPTSLSTVGEPLPEESSNGRRNTTPPDLLALSNMYFDRQQSLMGDFVHHHGRVSESAHDNRPPAGFEAGGPGSGGRPATSDDSYLLPRSRNPSIKLAPLNRQAASSVLEEASRIRVPMDRKRSHTHGLHLSVNFTSQGWRQALDPLKGVDERESNGLAALSAAQHEPTTAASVPHNTPEKEAPDEKDSSTESA